ncbi:MAG: MOSC N-terminal beta barrel domain-containing protein, partial [Actinomycetota bacterium]|nr:MOSC N-terminal beta barrel domain-containing protein [Actinomycetota bacterium]
MNSGEPVGTIRALWRYPVKSMLGEELDAVDLSEGGVVGDRAYALRDRETGKVASAKHP